jgi:hypothetical protein
VNNEQSRLLDPRWKKWGPYLSERQWGTVREDYSHDGNAWEYFSHDHARSRVYRWGEDGIAGISDEKQRVCFGLTLWNGKDAILKERLFGVSGKEGNHGEDVKELYYYLDNTPSHSYMKHLYKYPQQAYPYADLVRINRSRGRAEREYEILDTELFDNNRYFDVFTEYAKADPEDLCIRITIYNRADQPAYVAALPTLWLRNLWSVGLMKRRPTIIAQPGDTSYGQVEIDHEDLGSYQFYFDPPRRMLFTENETNSERLYGIRNSSPYVKDAFHDAVIAQDFRALEERLSGTKFAPLYEWIIPPGARAVVRLRLRKGALTEQPFETQFDHIFAERIREADLFYSEIIKASDHSVRAIQRQAFAGMLWSKQYFNLDIPRWLYGDPGQVPPAETRKRGRNHQWQTLNNEDIISMPDKWEYPWYAAWDLAFQWSTSCI